MFTCKYCSTEFLEHKPNCPNCGAPIKVSENNPKTGEPRSIREVCAKYEGTKNLHMDETIDARRMTNMRNSFNIPANETVIMLYDDTIFGSNKVGFAICSGGLYWKNDWSVDTKRTFLNWEAFTQREIGLDGYHIVLGRGDTIGMAGVGDEQARQQILTMLREIKAILQ